MPAVSDRDDVFAITGCRRYLDPPSGRRVLDGVLDQVPNGLDQADLVGDGGELVVYGQGQRQLTLVGFSREFVNRAACDVGQRTGLEREREAACFQTSELKQILGQSVQETGM